MMRWLRAMVCSASISILAPALATAEEPATVEPVRVEPVVVTATRIETPVEQLGASVSVVTGEEFTSRHYETVEDAVRSVPGLEVRRSGSLGKVTSLTLRGANANQVQVLVDGARVKSPTLGQVDLADIAPDLIERIEIIRGPQSAIYGADAIGGVVNIITKKGRGPFSGFVQQEAGNHDTLATRAGVSGSYRIFDYAVSASHLETNGQFRNDGMDQNSVSARFGVSFPFNSSLSFILRYSRTDTDLPVRGVFPSQPIVPVLDVNAAQQSETLVTSLAAHARPLAWWESDVRLSRYGNSLGFQNPADPGFPFDTPIVSQTTVERREAEWVNHFHVGAWSTSSIGLEYRDEAGDTRGAFSASTDTRSLFFEQQLRVLARLFLNGGVRVEDHSTFGTEVTGRGGLAYLIKAWGTRIRGSAGTGFRAPTLNELFFPQFGDPALRPERSVSFDAGLDQKLWADRLRLGLTYFSNRFEDLITCCGPPKPGFPFGSAINVGRARSEGVEATSAVDLLDTLTLSANYTFTDSKDLESGRPLPREPRHRWNVALTWEPVRRLSLFGEVHVVSRQFEPLGEVHNSGHTLVNLGGTYRLFEPRSMLRSVDLTARVQNVLDEAYADIRGFPALGINFLAGLRAAF